MSSSLAPYADLYENPKGPGDARPTALRILEDNDAIGNWQGRVILVTGGTSGIGTATTQALHATGADVYFTARDMEKGKQVAERIRETSPGNGKVEPILMDMDSLQSVKQASQDFLDKSEDKINVLINNAGIMGLPQSKTNDGFERQLGVNHLAHFALSSLLLPALVKSSSSDFNSRVVFLTSSAHRSLSILWDNINFEAPGTYGPFLAYAQSKTANIWTANCIDRVYGARGVHALSVHPGAVFSGLFSHTDPAMVEEWSKDASITSQAQTPEQGAATTVWAAAGKVWEGQGGKYLASCQVAPPTDDVTSIVSNGVGPHAYEVEGEDRLWKLSEELTGVCVAL